MELIGDNSLQALRKQALQTFRLQAFTGPSFQASTGASILIQASRTPQTFILHTQAVHRSEPSLILKTLELQSSGTHIMS